MKTIWRRVALLTSASTSIWAAGVGQETVQWQCPRTWNDCQLVRLDADGKVTAQAHPDDVDKVAASLVFSPDGQSVYSLGRTFAALDARTLKRKWVATNDFTDMNGGGVLSVSPDGQTLAVARVKYADAARKDWGNVDLLKAQTGEYMRTIARPPILPPKDGWVTYYNRVTRLAFSPDGQTLAIGTQGGGLRVHDLQNDQEMILTGTCGRPRPVAHAGAVRDLLWTAGNQLVSTANDGTVRLWKNGQQIGCLTVGQGGFKLHALPNHQLLVQNATTFTLINLSGFRKVNELGPVAAPVQTVQIGADRFTLVSAGAEHVYALPSGARLTVRGPDLATLKQGQVQVSVRPDMQVNVTRNGKSRVLNVKAVPPELYRSRDRRWAITLRGQQLSVTATNHLRVMTMEGDDFQNRYVWDMNTGKLLSCETWQMGLMYGGAPQKTEPDAACTAALQHGQRRQHIESIWHK